MDFYDMDEEQDDRGRRRRGGGGGSILKVIGFFIAFLFAPTALVSMLVFYVFMRHLKWKPRVSIFPIAIILMIMSIFTSRVLENITSLSSQSVEWPVFIGSFIYISIMLGLLSGYVIILYKANELRRYPEKKYIKGWAYEFQYTPTPLDVWRKKRNIESLKNGNEFDYKRAPIGVIDEPVKKGDLQGSLDYKNANKASITYRYYTEAMAHTLITGKTGSGKALHVDTEIRCKEKGWTTVGEIEIGDTLYDEEGNYTEVKAIYQPMTEDHYELTFDNGEVVRACGDHLWNIGNVYDENTVSTRELLNNYKYDKDYTIEHRIDEIKLVHKILKIQRVADEPEDYLCFTVDSDFNLFLITRSHIPTHNTVTMLNLIQNDILAGNPICVIDFKKSPDFIYFLSKWAQENDRKFHHFLGGKPGTYKNPYHPGQSTYDPLSTGSATAKADMILNLRTWDTSSEVFKKRTQDVLISLFFLLERTPEELVPGIEWNSGGLAQFVSALDLNNFKRMIELMAIDMERGNLSAGDIRRYNTLIELYKELSAKTRSDLKAQITELLSIARTLIVSNYGDWLASGASGSHIDLMDIATDEDAPIVLFSFNQQEEPEFAEYIGSIVMSDLSRVSALKNAKGNKTPFGVYIDEFQTLDPVTVKDNLEKARSSRMYITLSLQSIDQIISSAGTAGEAMANAIIDTTANFIFHDGSGFDTAEKMSKIIGKTNQYSYKIMSKPRSGLFKWRLMTTDDAMVNSDTEEKWLVPPSEFQSLESPADSNNYKATAYIINKSSEDKRFERSGGALARKVHVVVDSETAKGVPEEFTREIFIPRENPKFKEVQDYSGLDYMGPASVNDDGGWTIEDVEDVQDDDESNNSKESKESFNNITSELPTGPLNSISNKNTISDNDSGYSYESQNKKEESKLDTFQQLKAKRSDVKKEVAKEDTNKRSIKLPKL